MARIPIEIVDLRKTKDSSLCEAASLASALQSDFTFTDASHKFASELKLHLKSEVQSDIFFDAAVDIRKRLKGYHPYILFIIDAPLRSKEWSNLFSCRRAPDGLAIITTSQVVPQILLSHQMDSYFIYGFALHTLAFIVGGRQHHRDRRGCIFDFKEVKTDILISMNSGLLCDECKEWLLQNGHQLSAHQLESVEALLSETAKLLSKTQPANIEKPRMFVGSSTEGLYVAREIQAELQHDFHVELWNQGGVFSLGTITLEALESALDSYAMGIFVFTPDDKVEIRSTLSSRARDNVVFEAGLFIGRLGRFRTFIVHPSKGVALPSDLHGLTTATYDSTAPNNRAAIGPACQAIRKAAAAAVAAKRNAIT